MKEEVDAATRADDTVNGIFEVVAHGVPAGLGSYANWDERLDGQLAWAVMSLQAVKAVEIGRGVDGGEFRLAGARSDSLRGGENVATAGRRALRARTITQGAWRAASRTAKTLWCAAI